MNSFGTYMGRATTTRAYGDGFYSGGQITNSEYTGAANSHSLKDAQFGVFGYYTGTTEFATWKTGGTGSVYTATPNFMYNQQITWDNTKGLWTYTPAKYWPNGIDAANGGANPSNTATEANADQKLSFFAYAPYTAHLTTTTNATNKPESGDVGAVATKIVTEAVDANQATGIVAMSKNTETADIQLKYVLDAASEATAVDMLWGLRGQNNYQQTSNTANTVDPLGSAYNTDLTKQLVGEKVKFLFKHALARVGGSTSSTTTASGNQSCGLKVVVDVDGNSANPLAGADNQTANFASNFDNAKTLVTIKDVKIRDKYTYSHETGTTISETKSDFLTWGWFDIVTGEWTKTGTDLSLTTSSNGSIYNVEADNTGTSPKFALNDAIKEVDSDISNASGNDWTSTTRKTHSGVTTSPQNVYADNQDVPGLLLIPGTGTNTIYVTVDYLVRTADSNLSTGFTQIEQTITNKVELDGTILKPNKFYTLVMHLGLTTVKFEAIVADWSNAGGNYDENGVEINPGTENSTSVWLPSNVVKVNQNTAEQAAAASNVDVALTGLAASTTLTVKSVDGTVVSANADVTSLTTDASGNATVNIAYTANTGTLKRKGTVVLTDGFKTITITIPQAAGALAATKSTAFTDVTALGIATATALLTELKDAGGADVLTSATLTCAADWIHITGTDVSVDENTGAARNADVTITVNDATTTVNINQVAP